MPSNIHRAAGIEPHDSAALRHLSILQFALEHDAAIATALRRVVGAR
jgi:hypothetical protein